MSTTGKAVEPKAEVAEPEHPFQGLRGGCVRVARGARRPNRKVLSSLEIVLDPEPSEWVFAQAERTGQDVQQVVEALIDRARAARGATNARAP